MTEGPCSTLLLLSLSQSRCFQAVNLSGVILGGTQGSDQITLGDYFTGRPRVDGPGAEACTGEPHLPGAAARERESHIWACGVLAGRVLFPSSVFPVRALPGTVMPKSCLKEHYLWSQRKY